jgi:hypothetical protein
VAVATYEDVAVALGRPISTEVEQAQVEWWLTGIEHVIFARLGDLAELDQNVLLYVEVEAAVAKIHRAGRSESSVTVAVDDGSVTRRYENSISAQDVSDLLWDLLTPDSGTGAFTISPYGEPGYTEPDAWWSSPTELGG